ncbi:hypothetical protein C6I21_15715 [Alkalicoccus urumqiensis]|uniref:Uncharacterized protein n=1 Tax=Alkalicoccus urumqiensis TaxID=1548213 RepID=A0A2P6MDA9_ALKUR|nr:hypothetical protein C6I21_15715 [Alkalicoccus urumqiensis]
MIRFDRSGRRDVCYGRAAAVTERTAVSCDTSPAEKRTFSEDRAGRLLLFRQKEQKKASAACQRKLF